VIEKAKKNTMKYDTPYGEIKLEMEGKEIEFKKDGPILLKISYLIKIENVKEYINELQISMVEV
jgi:uncharacterized beta-barrel protein YwiB (DUF1934 family)